MGLTDHRHRRGVQSELAAILTAGLVAKLAGQDKPAGLAEWVKLRADFWGEVFPLKRPLTPRALTYRRVLANAARATALDSLTREYLLSWPPAGHAVQLALDGKTLRRTGTPEPTRRLHLLAADLPAEGLMLRQVAVAVHPHEIPRAPHMLTGLELQSKSVTGHALVAQRALSTLIVEAGAIRCGR